jgi:hypothetical protein
MLKIPVIAKKKAERDEEERRERREKRDCYNTFFLWPSFPPHLTLGLSHVRRITARAALLSSVGAVRMSVTIPFLSLSLSLSFSRLCRVRAAVVGAEE